MAVALGTSMLLGGAVITTATNLLPHPPQADENGYWAMTAIQLALMVVLIVKPRGPSDRWLPTVVVFAAMGLVSASVYFNGEKDGGPALFAEFFYVWPALYAGYFFSRRGLACALVLMAASYGWVLTAIHIDTQIVITRFIVAVSSVAGLAIAAQALRRQRDRLVERLRRAVRTDPLTQLLNRRGFDEAFAREVERMARTGRPLSVLVGDLDQFKALNDRYGHGAGDEALATVGATLHEAVRSIDTVARIGGEEFALLLPDTSAPDAFDAAERLRAAVSESRDPSGRALTISFGLVTCENRRATAEQLLAAADTALYQAKERGRDRCVAAPALRALAAA